MPRGSKKSYTSKSRRQAHNVEESGPKRGTSPKRAASLAYATATKQQGGGKRGRTTAASSSRKGGPKAAGRTAARRRGGRTARATQRS